MLIVGLTGGIGSGKTTVSDQFAKLGVDIIDADVIARHVVNNNADVKKAIANTFGTNILDNNQINRAKLREIIFNDTSKKQQLEDITHPIIRRKIKQALVLPTLSPYKIYSSPLLFETKQHVLADKVIVVDIPIETQITRTVSRDEKSQEQIKKVIMSQTSRQFKLDNADFVIDNSQSIEHTYNQVVSLHATFIDLA